MYNPTRYTRSLFQWLKFHYRPNLLKFIGIRLTIIGACSLYNQIRYKRTIRIPLESRRNLTWKMSEEWLRNKNMISVDFTRQRVGRMKCYVSSQWQCHVTCNSSSQQIEARVLSAIRLYSVCRPIGMLPALLTLSWQREWANCKFKTFSWYRGNTQRFALILCKPC